MGLEKDYKIDTRWLLKGGHEMNWTRFRYCTTCATRINLDSLSGYHGWCRTCRDVVVVRGCKVPYWAIGATFVVALSIPLTCGI